MILSKSKRQLIQKFKVNWGKQKSEDFDFDMIEYFFRNSNKNGLFQVISNKTINEIDFYDLFIAIDHTNSKIGQQYLFNKLLTIENNIDFNEQERLVEFFQNNEQIRLETQMLLSKLNKRESYYISTLFLDIYIQKPSWFWILKLLSILSTITLILTILIPPFFFLLLILITINLIIHYWNKRNIYTYMSSISQLSLLCRITNEIIKLGIPINFKGLVSASLKSIKKLRNRMSVFSIESKSNSDIASLPWAVLELIKIFFLIEPLIVFNVLKKLNDKRTEMQCLYEFSGKIDIALSVASLRNSLKYYCKPIILQGITRIEFEDIYHPLIQDCVSNSIKVNGKSVLLTGSNMSGKTTFIRTIAINLLCAQTINTCFARVFKTSPMRLFTAIRITDDLMNDKSYYFEEVLIIKDFINESQSDYFNLFLLDEIFKGTNTIERISAGKAVLSYIGKNKNIVFVSTHEIELTDLLKDTYELYHFTEVVENEQIHFDYKLKQGNLKTRNAIRILEINDYPLEVIEEAKEISKKINSNS